MISSDLNHDLIWKLYKFSYPEKAVAFLKRFEDSFCVYSRTVRQLYSNYELQRTAGLSNAVVTLPNPYAYHDTFNNVPEEAIQPTPFIVAPGEFKNTRTWMLCYKEKDTNRWKGLDFKKGIRKFKYAYGEDDPLLPVILNTNLRESSTKASPLMQLYRITMKDLQNLSTLQQSDIESTIEDKLLCA